MSHYSRSAHGSDHERRGRSGSRSREYARPVAYSTTRRSSSVGAPGSNFYAGGYSPRQGHGSHVTSSGYYNVSDNGQIRRHRSASGDRYRDPRHGHYSGYSGYGYVAAPSSGSGHHRRSSSGHGNSHYYAAPASTTYYADGRRSGESHRSHGYPQIRVIPDQNHERARQRSRSVESGRSNNHESFGEKMRRMFGLGPSGDWKHESRRHEHRYGDPGTGKHVVGSGKAYRSKEMQYMDRNTGREVDSKGRPIYTV